MAKNYTAFISYRHCPLDTAVAESIHKRIERYRVPKDLRKEGQKNLGVVFRDRDELPLSNDLTQDIYEALDNARYLIVVCTPETPKSLWVDREIQHFLLHHSQDRILTVLAAGTPEESIPRRITTVYGPDEETVVDQVEPLCAYLVDENEKKVLRNLKSEFLRLAAAILECPYDALKQRQKRYRTRRIIAGCAAATAVLLSIMGLLIQWNLDVTQKNEEISRMNEEIQEQLRQTQLKESQALTLVSQNQLAEGDRTGALQTAMEALPGEEGERPFYAPAKTALEKALGLYYTGYYPDLRLEIPSGISAVAVSDDGHFAAGVTGNGYLTCYNLYTGQTLWEVPQLDEYAVESFFFLPNQEGILCTSMGGNQFVLDAQTGKLRFSYATEKRSFPLDYAPNGYQMAVSADGCILFCDLQKEHAVFTEPVEANASPHPCEGAYSVDGSRFLLLCAADFGAGEQLRMRLFDTASGEQLADELLVSPQTEVWQENVTALEDGGFFLSFNYGGLKICCRISPDGELLNAGSFTFADDYRTDGTVLSDPQGEARQVGDTIYLAASGRFCQIDPDSCQLIKEYKLLSSEELCWVYEDGSYMVRRDDQFRLYTPKESGGFSLSRSWDCELPLEYLTFDEKDPDIFLSYGDALQVIRWVGEPGDPLSAVQELPHTLSGNLIYLPGYCGVYTSTSGENLFILDTDATVNDEGRQYAYNISANTVTEMDPSPSHAGVFSSDESKLLTHSGVWDLEMGTYTDFAETVTTVSRNDQLSGMPALAASYEDGVLRWWLDGAEQGLLENPWHTENTEILRVGQNGYVLLSCSDAYVLCNTQTGQWQQLPASINGGMCVALGRETPLAAFASADGGLYLYDISGDTQLLHLKDIAYDCFSMIFIQKDRMLLLANNKGYTLVDLDSGTVLTHIAADFSYQGLGETYLRVQESLDGRKLYISNTLAETPGLVIETESWTLEWEIAGMLGYLPCCDGILCTDSVYTRLMIHPNLSTEELLAMGEKILAGARF